MIITETCAHLDIEAAAKAIRARRVWAIIYQPWRTMHYLEFSQFFNGGKWVQEHQPILSKARLPLIDSDATGVP